MTEPPPTQRDLRPDIAAELDAADLVQAEEIGRGGFGVVYRCVQRSLDRQVAVKVLSADLDQENRARFLREEHAMGRLSGHPNIVDILQVDVTLTGRPYIVMPYHARGSLDALIRSAGPIAWTDALRIGVKVAGALESAHRIGILHRDVKPANILLTAYEEPQLTDFGIARVPGGFETSTNAIAGSPAFTAPEVLRGLDPTPLADVYGLGATLFCLMTGHAAYERRAGEKVVAQFLRITSAPIPDLRGQGLPPDVADAIEAAMSGEPGDRPASAAELGLLLQDIEDCHGLLPDDMALPAQTSLGWANKGTDDNPSGYLRRDRRAHSARNTSVRAPVVVPGDLESSRSRGMLARERLLDVLRTGRERRLVIVDGPAGSGKSTLIAQWRDELMRHGAAVAWVSVDDDNNNSSWFISDVIAAIARVHPGVSEKLIDTLEVDLDDAVPVVLDTLVDTIGFGDTPVVLVVDGWQRISDSATTDALEMLLDKGGHRLQVIVIGWSGSGRIIDGLRVRDEVVEIDSSAMNLDLSEAKEFLVAVHGVEIGDADVTELWTATGGWVAALQLVALSLRGKIDPTGMTTVRPPSGSAMRAAKLISRMSASRNAIGEYLVENVLNSLEPKMTRFLTELSVSESVSGGLATALFDDADALTMLDDVGHRNLFVRRIDKDSEWYRFQPLFAQILHRRLERVSPGRARVLNVRASRWFAQNHMLRQAVSHAVAAPDFELASDLMESHGMELVDNGRVASFLGMLSKLPAEVVSSRPRLLMAIARANVLVNKSAAAREALDRISQVLEADAEQDSTNAILRVEADVLRASDGIASDLVTGADELVAEALSRPTMVPAWVVSLAANVRSFVRLSQFDFDAVRTLQEWAAEYHARSTDPMSAVAGGCYAGIAAREQLDIVAAAASFGHALEIASRAIGPDTHAARLAGAMLGQLYYDQDDLETGENLLDEAYRFAPDIGGVDVMIPLYVTGARIKALRGDREAAAVRLQEGARVAAARSLPRLAGAVECEQLYWGLTSSRLLARGAGAGSVVDEQIETAEIRALIMEKGRPHAQDALTRADTLVQQVETRNRPLSALKVRLLLSACQFVAGRIDEAKSTLAPLVAICVEIGIERVLRDGGPEVIDTISMLAEDLRNDRWQAHWPTIPEKLLLDLTDDL